jgi:hypothetical protein
MAFGFGDLQAKGQGNQDAAWNQRTRKDIKKLARPDWYTEWYKGAVPELLGMTAPMRERVEWLSNTGGTTMGRGIDEDARHYGASSAAPGLISAVGGYKRGVNSNALLRFWQQALANAAEQAGASRRGTIGALGGQRSPQYRMPGAAQGLDQLSNVLGGVGMGLMTSGGGGG